MEKTNLEKVEDRVTELFEEAMEIKLDLPEDEDLYDLPFIQKKLALVGVNQERLSDISFHLTKASLEITKASTGARALLEKSERDLKQGSGYKATPRDEKTTWLEEQLQEKRNVAEQWTTLKRLVSEVRDAIVERAQTMRRLDSDLRLHVQLYAEKVRATGALSPGTPTGQRIKGLDIE